jgi:hypothetical protein
MMPLLTMTHRMPCMRAQVRMQSSSDFSITPRAWMIHQKMIDPEDFTTQSISPRDHNFC